MVNLALLGARIMMQAIRDKYENRGLPIPARIITSIVQITAAANQQGVGYLLVVPL
jgi:hypothetical protein